MASLNNSAKLQITAAVFLHSTDDVPSYTQDWWVFFFSLLMENNSRRPIKTEHLPLVCEFSGNTGPHQFMCSCPPYYYFLCRWRQQVPSPPLSHSFLKVCNSLQSLRGLDSVKSISQAHGTGWLSTQEVCQDFQPKPRLPIASF